ncbi:MAG: hypothetical protein HETSPECPRED_006848 [Heterodermia speciosa]|uniref:Uncharacterized protein n=1 Tax=Heterodermia speciosa TaxID=116794 RepID=A0A8H3FM16_9LECA|nr:MAG: hypothetical protein HETSPECPRED_006848 [Heterodermia speciosa]
MKQAVSGHAFSFPETSKISVTWNDALDEFENQNDIRGVIELFARAKGLGQGRLRVFMTSRQKNPIRLGFVKIPEDYHCDFVLHNVSPSLVNQDVSTFHRHKLKNLDFSESWPSESDMTNILLQSVSDEYDEEERELLFGMFRDIVGSIVILAVLLSTAVLAKLTGTPQEEVD